MNELISPAAGIPVPYKKLEPRHMGTNFFINPDKLEKNIIRLLQMPPSQKEEYGTIARNWFNQNDSSFNQKLVATLQQIL